MYKVSIPEITDEELMKRYTRIKPIAEINGTKYWLREYTLHELRKYSYIWYVEYDKTHPVDMRNLQVVPRHDFECFHTYGYPGFFKPSIAEVLSQIPQELLDNVQAFEIIHEPRTAKDFYKNHEAFSQGFHSSTVRLYFSRKKLT